MILLQNVLLSVLISLQYVLCQIEKCKFWYKGGLGSIPSFGLRSWLYSRVYVVSTCV